MFEMLCDAALALSHWVGFVVIIAFQLLFGYLSLYFAYEFAKILEKRDKTCFSVEVVVQSFFLVSCVTIVCVLDILNGYTYV
jgi:hypothetical protein